MSETTVPASDVVIVTSEQAAAVEATRLQELEEAGRRVAAAQLLSEMMDRHKVDQREAYRALLEDEFARTKGKTFVVSAPDGRTIGQASFTETADETQVAVKDDFAAWVAEFFDTEVEYTITVRPAFAKRLLSREVAWVPDPDAEGDDAPLIPVYIGEGDVPQDRRRVPGLILRRGKVDTSTFRFNFQKPKAGAAITVDNQATGRQIVADLLDEVIGDAFGAAARTQIDA